MKILAVLFAGSLLASCATATSTTIAQGMEKADTDAATAYATIASLANAAEVAHPSGIANDEAIKVKAWNIFVAEHKAYQLGQTFDISGLLALVSTARGL